jgi:hypothetical protein
MVSVTHAAIATGAATNFKTTGTWADCYMGYSQSVTTATALTTSYQLNTAVQPGAMTINGIGVRLAVRTGTTGTMTVSLYGGATSGTANAAVTTDTTYLDDSRLAQVAGDWVGGVITCDGKTMTITSSTATRFTGSAWAGGTPSAGSSWAIVAGTTGGTQVTINTADLPVAATADINGGWIFMEFTGNVTLAAATNYQVQAKTSSASQVSLFSLATTNWSAYLRTTTSTAIADSDDFIITREYISAGSSTLAIVTMDNDNTTDFGSVPVTATSLITPGISVCTGGMLNFGIAASTAYKLKMSNSIIVYSGGILTMGIADTSGTANAAVTTNDTTLTDTRLAMTTNYYVGATITCNGKTMTVTSNTATVFTGASWSGGGNPGNGYAWTSTGLTMPSTSSGYINFDCGANVDYGLVVRNLGTFVSQGATKTCTQTLLTASNGGYCTTSGTAVTAVTDQAQSFTGLTGTIKITNVDYTIASVTDATHLTLTGSAGTQSTPTYWIHAGTANVVTLGDTTGWAGTDTLAFASTSRTAADCESATISTVDSSTQVTLSTSLTKTHLGISPTQAEVINLTRNVKIYGASATLQGYVSFAATSIVDIDYTEFYWLGSNTAGKYGIDIATTTGSCNIQYSSLYNFIVTGSRGIVVTGNTTNNITFSYNVSYSINGAHIHLTGATSGSLIYINYNTVMYNNATSNSYGIYLQDIGITCTNNRIIGTGSQGLYLSESNAVIGTISDMIVHSCSGGNAGVLFSGAIYGTISNFTIWRIANAGLYMTSNGCTLDNWTLFGNSNYNIWIANSGGTTILNNFTMNSEVVFSTGINIDTSSLNGNIKMYNSTLDAVSGIKTATSYFCFFTGNYVSTKIYLTVQSTTLAPTTAVIGSQTLLSYDSYISFQKYNGNLGDHRTYKQTGTITTDTVVYNTASPSMKMTPTTAALTTNKFESGSFKVNVVSGQTCTPSVYVRLSEAAEGDAANYSGSAPRLILKRNDALGITADVVLDTHTGVIGNPWDCLTGTTAAATDDGVYEFVIDGDFGTANSFFNIDDFTAIVT